MKSEHRDILAGLFTGRVEFDARLDRLTTFGLGGRAAALVEPDNVEELARVLDFVREKDLPVFLLGGGSNVLFKDSGFRGVVIRLGESFKYLNVDDSDREDVFIEAGAAVSTQELVLMTRNRGYEGLEFLIGIPGRIGGALFMNAGAMGGWICDKVQEIEVMDRLGRIISIQGDSLKASYRKLDLPEGVVILKAVFKLKKASPEEVNSRALCYKAKRTSSQPQGVRTAGCIFRNPEGDAAGRLIDRAGLKGLCEGGAWVAEEHANFIVHKGGATAAQVLELIEKVRATVREKFKVDLEPEIKIVGTDE